MIYLFLNSISTGEVIIIMIFILMFFGSKNIPGMASSLGKALRQVRDATDDIKRDIRQSVDGIEKEVKENMKIDKEIKETISSFQKDVDTFIKKPKRVVKDNIKEVKDSINEAINPLAEKSKSEPNKVVPGLKTEIKEKVDKSKEDKSEEPKIDTE